MRSVSFVPLPLTPTVATCVPLTAIATTYAIDWSGPPLPGSRGSISVTRPKDTVFPDAPIQPEEPLAQETSEYGGLISNDVSQTRLPSAAPYPTSGAVKACAEPMPSRL